MLVWGPNCSEPSFDTIANTGEGTIVKKARDVPPVPDINLFPRIMNRSISIRRILKFNDTYREAIDEKKHIWPTCFGLSVIDVLDSELVNDPEYIVVHIVIINKRNHSRCSIFAYELNTVYHPTVNLVKCSKVRIATDKTNIVSYQPYLIILQIRILLLQKLQEIIHV